MKSGYFNSGLPFNRLGNGPRRLVVFQGRLGYPRVPFRRRLMKHVELDLGATPVG